MQRAITRGARFALFSAPRAASSANQARAEMPPRASIATHHHFIRSVNKSSAEIDAVHKANMARVLYDAQLLKLEDLPENDPSRFEVETQLEQARVFYEAKVDEVKSLQGDEFDQGGLVLSNAHLGIK